MNADETNPAPKTNLLAALFKSVLFIWLAIYGPGLMLQPLAYLLATVHLHLTIDVITSLRLGFSLLLLWFFARLIDRTSWHSYGLTAKNPLQALTEFYDGALIGSCMVAAVTFALFALGCYSIQAINPNNQLLAIIPTLILAALYEEIIFRGYVLQTIERASNTYIAALVSSVLFGFAHLGNFEAGVPLATQLLSCMTLSLDAGILFCAAFLVTRRIWLPLGLHAFWNIFEGPVFGTLVSGNQLGRPLFISTMDGPTILTGGIFGPESSAIELIICLAIAWWLWRLRYNSRESS